MFYVVTPPADTSWHVDRQTLVKLLRSGWPDIDVRLAEAGSPAARDVVWRVRVGSDEMEGSQDRAGQAHYLEGPPEAVAQFAAWWRRQVPEQQPLILCDESYSTVVHLDSDVSERELARALS